MTAATMTPSTRPTRPAQAADLAAWVDATPFRALFRQLMSDTGLPAPVLGAAVGLPTRLALALANRTCRRMRWVDADALLRRSFHQLQQEARGMGDPARAVAALVQTCPELTPAQLARLLRTDLATATGLAEGWLERCPTLVIWRALALADGWTTLDAALGSGGTPSGPRPQPGHAASPDARGATRPDAPSGDPAGAAARASARMA